MFGVETTFCIFLPSRIF